MPETTPLIKAALNLRGGAGFDVYDDVYRFICIKIFATTEQIAAHFKTTIENITPLLEELYFVQRRIRTYFLEDDPRHSIAKCSWTRR